MSTTSDADGEPQADDIEVANALAELHAVTSQEAAARWYHQTMYRIDPADAPFWMEANKWIVDKWILSGTQARGAPSVEGDSSVIPIPNERLREIAWGHRQYKSTIHVIGSVGSDLPVWHEDEVMQVARVVAAEAARVARGVEAEPVINAVPFSVGTPARIDGTAQVDGSIEWPLLNGYDGYPWTTFREGDGTPILRYGHERMPLEDWTDSKQAEFCAKITYFHAAPYLARVVRTARAFFEIDRHEFRRPDVSISNE